MSSLRVLEDVAAYNRDIYDRPWAHLEAISSCVPEIPFFYDPVYNYFVDDMGDIVKDLSTYVSDLELQVFLAKKEDLWLVRPSDLPWEEFTWVVLYYPDDYERSE